MVKIAQHVPVLDGWGGFSGEAIEPEHLSFEEWTEIRQRISARW